MENIKKFDTANDADQYAIRDIPFITSIATVPIQNLTCNEENKKIVVSDGIASIVDNTVEKLIPNVQFSYCGYNGVVILESINQCENIGDYYSAEVYLNNFNANGYDGTPVGYVLGYMSCPVNTEEVDDIETATVEWFNNNINTSTFDGVSGESIDLTSVGPVRIGAGSYDTVNVAIINFPETVNYKQRVFMFEFYAE